MALLLACMNLMSCNAASTSLFLKFCTPKTGCMLACMHICALLPWSLLGWDLQCKQAWDASHVCAGSVCMRLGAVTFPLHWLVMHVL